MGIPNITLKGQCVPGDCMIIPGDINCDNKVDLEDLQIFASRWLDTDCLNDPNCCDYADLTLNGTVSLADYAVFAESYGLFRPDIKVFTDQGFRPLNYSIVPTIDPNIMITLPSDIPISDVTVLLDGTDPNIPTQDLTDLFISDLLSPARTAIATVPVLIDNNTITVTVISDGQPYYESASMLNYTDDTLVVSTLQFDSIVDPETEVEYEDQVLMLNFTDDAYFENPDPQVLDAINHLLRREKLIPLDIGVPTRLVRTQITNGESPLQIAQRLAQLELPFIEAVLPNITMEDNTIAAETFPLRLRNTYRESAGPQCTAGTGVNGCFDFDGPDNTNELRIFRYDFIMDTFAAHRLVEAIQTALGAQWQGEQAGLAIVDRGLGNGTDPCAGNPLANTYADVPCNELFRISDTYQNPLRFNANGVQVDGANNPLNLDLSDIGDSANSHGTSVTAAAAARGNLVLGPGKHVIVRPMRRTGTWHTGNYAILAAIRDNQVAVVNTSFSSSNIARQNSFINAQIEGGTIDIVNQARLNGKIWVVTMGNDGQNVGNVYPAMFAPGPVSRMPDDPLVVAVSACETSGYADGMAVREPEQLSSFSNFGDRTSVAARGRQVILPDRSGTLRPVSGTSFAAPTVAGLSAEMIYLDRNMRIAANRFTPLQIIEIVEATAEDLGSNANTVINNIARPNDNPGDGVDPYFGHGRINVWKAILSVANGGLATDRSVEFPSLDDDNTDGDGERIIDESETTWYGFKIITSVKGASVWINGVQLKETAAILPDGNGAGAGVVTDEINAYAGVRSDQAVRMGIPKEDPTSGVIPVGNYKGEYIITFSITRDELLIGNDINQPKTLSLRRPDQTGADTPFFNLKLELEKMRDGKVPGVVFDDFVFEITPTDFGDAPPEYPSSLKDEGARHINTNLEWLGKPDRSSVQSVSSEPDAIALDDYYGGDQANYPDAGIDPDGTANIRLADEKEDLDRFDDGVVFFPLTYIPGQEGKVEFTVCVSDPNSGRYNDDPNRCLYVNAWIDWDTNGIWGLFNQEYVLTGLQLNPAGPWTEVEDDPDVTRKSISPSGRCATFEATFTLPAVIGDEELWARFRLDYGEDAGFNSSQFLESDPNLFLDMGCAYFGEVEDYLIGSDFGDAPDQGSGEYPTLKDNAGARHLDIYKEWLAVDKSREPDACLTQQSASADQDGQPNLGLEENGCQEENLDLDEGSICDYTIFHLPDDLQQKRVELCFTVHSTISARGYDLMGQDDDGDGRIDEDPYADGVDDDGDGSDGEDGPNTIKVDSMGNDPQNPGTLEEFSVLSTPPASGGKGRYHATEVDDDRDGANNEDPIDGQDNDADGLIDEDPAGLKPLILNIWVDWNDNKLWSDTDDWVLQDVIIAPETFGGDEKYTLGEPFADSNHNGVYDNGETFTDSAGIDSRSYACEFHLFEDEAETDEIGWIRIRLAYAETSDMKIPGTTDSSELLVDAAIAHSTEEDRILNGETGGSLFGEVEDATFEDICGDGICGITENPTNCPEDCDPNSGPWFIAWNNPMQCHGDANCSLEGNSKTGFWRVGAIDLDILAAAFDTTYPHTMYDASADFNRDYSVNYDDQEILETWWMIKEPPHGPGIPNDCPVK
ncbi:MAG: S8/S53 family peptidase [Sedimentisphaerales bacterium]|nr:S8/S53 family peptidase [Sedimentisphaerales bacterium]